MRARDDFTDTDLTSLDAHTPDMGSGWVEDVGAWAIFGNALSQTVAANCIARNLTVLADKQAAELIIGATNNPVGPGIRGAAGPDGYVVYRDVANNLQIYRVDNNTYNLVSSTTFTTGSTTGVWIDGDGDDLTVKIDGVNRLTGTDATYAAGTSLIYGVNGTDLCDQFAAYDDAGVVAAGFLLVAN